MADINEEVGLIQGMKQNNQGATKQISESEQEACNSETCRKAAAMPLKVFLGLRAK